MYITRYEPQYRPLGLLGRLVQEQDKLLRNLSEPDTVTDWSPAVDIREEDKRFVLQADLPGVDPDAIEVTMDDGVLTLTGSRKSESSDAKPGYKRFERVSGTFMRRFTLPETANGEEISAETCHGVLEISIPKQAKPQPRKITVRSA